MTLTIIAILVVSILAIIGGKMLAVHSCTWDNIGISILFCGMIGVVLSIILAICSVQCSKDAELLNSTYGTAYTTEQMFWNGSDIKAMIIGNRTRLQIEK